MKLFIKIVLVSFILFSSIRCNNEFSEDLNTPTSTEQLFFNIEQLKLSDEKSQFLNRIIFDFKKQNYEEDFVPEFIEKYGFPNWSCVRYFANLDEKVALIPVYSENGFQTNSIILCVEKNSIMNYRLISRNNINSFAKNVRPRPTIEKIRDLFIIFDFQMYGNSRFLINGKVSNFKEGDYSLKSAYYAPYEICYWIIVETENGTSSRYDCDTHYIWIEESLAYLPENNDSSCDNSNWFDEPEGGSDLVEIEPLFMPVVDETALLENERANCVYTKLLNSGLISSLISRYFGFTSPTSSILGELSLVWAIEEIPFKSYAGKILANTYPIGSPSNPRYAVKISISPEHINNDGITNIAYTMLHEAVHAKLIADYYDDEQTTDFSTLFKRYSSIYGGDAQHITMAINYITILAEELRKFDLANGIENDVELYKNAIRFQLSTQLGLPMPLIGENEYYDLIQNSPFNCLL